MKARLQRERTGSSCTGEKRTLFDEVYLERCVLLQLVRKRYLLEADRPLKKKKK